MRKAFWVDFENAPHIPVLLPIVKELQGLGYTAVMTSRDFSFTGGLIERHGLPARMIGRGSSSASSLAKALRIAQRVVSLIRFIRPLRNEIAFSVAHASRSQLFAAHLLGITSVSLEDYEYSSQFHNGLSTYLLVPEPIPFSSFPKNKGEVIHYPGIKEEIYLCSDQNGASPPDDARPAPDMVNVLFRPEGRTAHYRSPASEELQRLILGALGSQEQANLLIYPRDQVQRREIEAFLKRGKARFSFPSLMDGAELIASVDLVVGGGGTMTREASVLGVPSYSFFSGRWGAVDKYLEARGDLAALHTEEDIPKIRIEKRLTPVRHVSTKVRDFVTGFLSGLRPGGAAK